MSSYRKNKVANEIKRIVAQALISEVKDPRLSLVTVTHIKLSDDLQIAHLSWLTSSKVEHSEVEKALKSATPFLRSVLAKQLNIKRVPQIFFHYDESFESANQMMELLSRLKAEGQMGTEGNDEYS